MRQCEYIAGDPRVDPSTCGKETKYGSSYCDEHHAICWMTPDQARRAKARWLKRLAAKEDKKPAKPKEASPTEGLIAVSAAAQHFGVSVGAMGKYVKRHGLVDHKAGTTVMVNFKELKEHRSQSIRTKQTFAGAAQP